MTAAPSDRPPRLMPGDRRGWRVVPALDGRGTPEERKPRPPHRLPIFWIILVLLFAINFSTEVPSFWNDAALTALLQSKGVQVNAQAQATGSSLAGELLLGFGPTLLLVAAFLWLARRPAPAGPRAGLAVSADPGPAGWPRTASGSRSPTSPGSMMPRPS